jgi:hypothetical protein
MAQDRTISIAGQEVTVTPIEEQPGGGARIDVEADDGRRWRVDVTATGELDAVVTTWQDGELRDLDRPWWLEDVIARLARAA